MADTRNIKRSICTSADIDKLTWFAEVLFYRLIVNCDECGRFDGRESVIKGTLFPLKRNLTLKNINDAVLQLESAGLIQRYTVGGEPFLYLPTWSRYQRVRYEGKYPAPTDSGYQPLTAAVPLPPSSPLLPPTPPNNTPISPNSVQSAEKEIKASKNAPTREEIERFADEKGLLSVSTEDFYEHYTNVGWDYVRNWRAMLIEWDRKDAAYVERLIAEEEEDFERIKKSGGIEQWRSTKS